MTEQEKRRDDTAIKGDDVIADSMAVLFDDYLWKIVTKALEDRDGRTEFSEVDAAFITHFFEDHCADFVLEYTTTDRHRERGEIATRMTVPESWRRVFKEKRSTIERDRLLYGAFYEFGNAAANLYGAVSEKDLTEIADHWLDSAPWLEQEVHDEMTPEMRRNISKLTAGSAIRMIMIRQQSPYAVAYVDNDLAISYGKYPPDPSNWSAPKALLETLNLRSGKERWYPETFDDFMDWESPNTRDWPDEYDDLEDFVLDNWQFDMKDEDDQNELDCALEAAHDALAAGRMWNGAVDAMREFLDFSNLPEDEVPVLAKILCRCANATRQDANWGFSPNELVRAKGLGGTFDVQSVPIDSAGKAGTPIVRATVKVGRNDPCPCGSGKKFKKCCGR